MLMAETIGEVTESTTANTQNSAEDSFNTSLENARKKKQETSGIPDTAGVLLPEEAGVDNWVEMNPGRSENSNAPNWVEENPPQLADDDTADGITKEQTKGIAQAADKLSVELGELTDSDQHLNEAEKQLAKKDKINLAVARQLGVDINPERDDLSITESSIAREEPLVFAMLQHNGIKIRTDEFGATVVESRGNNVELSENQKNLLSTGNVSAFSKSLLGNMEADKETEYLLAASGIIRPGYTKAEADHWVAKGEPEKARETVTNSLESALLPAQRQAVWDMAGKDYFTADYFREQLNEQRSGHINDSTAMYHTGEWMKEAAENLPSEAAAVALDVVMEDFSNDWIDGKKNRRGSNIGASDGKTLYKGISSLVEKAPQQAGNVSEWLISPESPGNALYRKMKHDDFDVIVETAEDGHGVILASAMRDTMAEYEHKPIKIMTAGISLPDSSTIEEFDEQLAEARQIDGRRFASDISSDLFANFAANQEQFIQNRFDHLAGMDGIEQTTSYSYNSVKLRNIVGMAMGFEPDDKETAKSREYEKLWFNDDTEKSKQIDLIVRWIVDEADGDFTYKAKPFIYASEVAGVSNGALFEVTKSNGETIIIDGSMADDVLAEHQGNIEEAQKNTNLNYKYDDLEDFFDDNYLDPEGKIYMAKGQGLTDADNDGHVDVEALAAANVTAFEKYSPWAMTAVGVVGFVGGIVLAIPSAGTSLGISAGAAGLMTGASMVIGTAFSTHQLFDMAGHGRDVWTLSNDETRGAWLNLAGSALAVGALGAGAKAATLMKGADNLLPVGTPAAINQARIMSGRSLQWANAAKTTGHSGAALGIGQMGDQMQQTVRHWDEMTTTDALLAIFDTGMGVADFGVGVYAGRHQQKVQAQSDTHSRQAAQKIYQAMLDEKRGVRSDKPIVVGRVENWNAEETLFIPLDGSQPTLMRVVEDPVTGEKSLSPKSEWRGRRDRRESGEFEIKVSDEVGSNRETDPEFADGYTPTGVEEMSREDYFPLPRDPDRPVDPARYRAVAVEGITKKPVPLRRKVDDAVGDFLRKFLMEIKSSEDLYDKYRARVVEHQKNRGRMENENFDARKTPESTTEFRPDDKTRVMANMPGGLRHVANDIHVHSMGYDRRTGNWMIAMSYRVGRNTRFVSGSIPQFCGAEHYLNPNPNIATLKLAQLLDQRALDDYRELLTTESISARVYSDDDNDYHVQIPGRYLAAKIDLSLTGLDFSETGTQNPVAYARQMMLDNPGMFSIIGEVTGKKEHVSNLLGPSAWDMNSPKFREYLGFAQETGQAILLHYDWGNPEIGRDGRAQAVKMDYSNLDEIMDTLGAVDENGKRIYDDVNIIMAHTGIGRYVRPNDKAVPGTVRVHDADGNVTTKEITAPEHIHKLYEFFDRVPNAKADISWNDVAQAYSDSPALREGIVQFILDNQDRLIWGSDSVKPNTRAHYNQALNSSKTLMLDIALRDPGALRKLLRGNYEAVLADAQYRTDHWTAKELKATLPKKEASEQTRQMYQMREALKYYRERMDRGAERDFQLWVHRVQELAEQGKLNIHENPGMFPMLYDSLSDAQRIEGAHHHDHDHTADQGGIGSSGGKLQNDPEVRKKIYRDSALIGGTAAVAAGALSTVMGGPGGDALNGAAFASRSVFATQRAEVVERFRQYAKNIFGRRGQGTDFKIDKDQINLLCTMIDDSASALNLSDEQVLRAFTAVQQFWVNYQHLKNAPHNNRTGFTKWQQHHAITSLVGELQITLARELRMDVNFIDPMDARTDRGYRYNAGLMLSTLAVNEAASVAWLREVFGDNPPDLTTPEGLAETAFKGFFFAGNTLMAGRMTALTAAGRNKVSVINSQIMKQFQRLEAHLYTVAGASWTIVDAMNALHILDDIPSSSGEAAARAATAATKVALDAAFTYAMRQTAQDAHNNLSGHSMRDPHDMHTTKMLLLGALAMRTSILAVEGAAELWEAWKEEEKLIQQEKREQQEMGR